MQKRLNFMQNCGSLLLRRRVKGRLTAFPIRALISARSKSSNRRRNLFEIAYRGRVEIRAFCFSMSREIPLTQGKVAIVDDEDFEFLMQFKWLYHKTGARRQDKRKVVWMHQLLLPNVEEVDHRDCDNLNNQKSNLRPANNYTNRWNRRRCSRNTSGYKGVSPVRDTGRFVARIGCLGNKYYLGTFDNAVDAAHAYNNAARRLHGEFARLNRIPHQEEEVTTF